MRVAVVGEGAIGRSHVEVISAIRDVELAVLVGADEVTTAALATKWRVPEYSLSYEDVLTRDDLDAVVLCTPTPLHASQGIAALWAGKHCLIEVPMADSLADAEALTDAASESGLVAMICQTRRYNRGDRWLREQFLRGDLHLQHLVVNSLFFRRANTNFFGEPRNWTDSLLWHHACHTVDLFQYQTDQSADKAFALRGPIDRTLGIELDMTIGLTAPSGELLSFALSFNNVGEPGTYSRYICDRETYIARFDSLTTPDGLPVDTSSVGSETGPQLQDREFFDAIATHREPNSSAARCLETMRTLDRLQSELLRISSN